MSLRCSAPRPHPPGRDSASPDCAGEGEQEYVDVHSSLWRRAKLACPSVAATTAIAIALLGLLAYAALLAVLQQRDDHQLDDAVVGGR